MDINKFYSIVYSVWWYAPYTFQTQPDKRPTNHTLHPEGPHGRKRRSISIL